MILKYLLLFTAFLSFSTVSRSACFYKNSQMEKKRLECVGSFGRDWDCKRNTCFNEVETTNLRKDWKACNNLTPDQKEACYDNVAYNHSEIRELDEATRLDGKYSSATVGGIFYTLNALDKSVASQATPCTSKKVMKKASLINLGLIAYMEYRSRSQLKALAEDYAKKSEELSDYDAQFKALEHLKAERELVRDLAKSAKKSHMLSAALYGASGVIAVAEIALIKTPPCSGIGPISDTPTGVSDGGMFSKVINTSTGIAAFSLTGASLSLKLSEAAKIQEEKASQEIKKIEELMKKFPVAAAGYCSKEQRESISGTPDCYCRNDDGSKNENRTNSDICNQYWEGIEKNIFVPASSYASLEKAKNKKVCILKSGQVDKDCKCRQLLNEKNENACLKVSMNRNEMSSVGNVLGMKGLMNSVNSLSNGKYGFSDLDSSDLARSAIRNKRYLKAELNKLATQDAINKIKRSPLLPKMRTAFLKKSYREAESIPGNKSLSLDELAKSIRPKDEFIQNAENEDFPIRKSKISYSGGRGTLNKRNKESGTDFDTYSQNQGDGSIKGPASEPEGVFEDNDIIKKPDVSIFKIIRTRYIKTAWPRFMGVEFEEEADEI